MRQIKISVREQLDIFLSFFNKKNWIEFLIKIIVMFLSGSFTYLYLLGSFWIINYFGIKNEGTYYKWFVIPVILLPRVILYGFKTHKSTRDFILNIAWLFLPLFILIIFMDKNLMSDFKEYNLNYFFISSGFPAVYFSSELFSKIGNFFGDKRSMYDDCVLIIATCVGLNYGFNYLVGVLIIISNKDLLLKFANFLSKKLGF